MAQSMLSMQPHAPPMQRLLLTPVAQLSVGLVVHSQLPPSGSHSGVEPRQRDCSVHAPAWHRNAVQVLPPAWHTVVGGLLVQSMAFRDGSQRRHTLPGSRPADTTAPPMKQPSVHTLEALQNRLTPHWVPSGSMPASNVHLGKPASTGPASAAPPSAPPDEPPLPPEEEPTTPLEPPLALLAEEPPLLLLALFPLLALAEPLLLPPNELAAPEEDARDPEPASNNTVPHLSPPQRPPRHW